MLFHESFLVAKMSCYKNFTFFNKIKTATEGGKQAASQRAVKKTQTINSIAKKVKRKNSLI
jgi:hypothetical protein